MIDVPDDVPDFEDIKNAHERIKGYIHKTPILTCHILNRFTGAKLFFKCENFQKVGAFKFRGAMNAVLSLTRDEAKNGVATHSSGNHAQALALAAKIQGIPASIVMPQSTPKIKKEAVVGYGGIITFCEPNMQSREKTLEAVARKTGAAVIHPFDNSRVIAGQGTCALELLTEINDLDMIITPVGGGGLISGTAIAAHGIAPRIKVVGAEPSIADDAFRSLRDNKIYPSQNSQTIADGLRGQLCQRTFAIIKDKVSEIATATEAEISAAMQLVWERMKIVIEPSAALPLAVLLNKKVNGSNLKIGIIISGGNTDLRLN